MDTCLQETSEKSTEKRKRTTKHRQKHRKVTIRARLKSTTLMEDNK